MSSVRSVLADVMCPTCNTHFKVADVSNFVCTTCYYRQIPKYIKPRKKPTTGAFEQFAKKNPELIDLLISEAAEWTDIADRDEAEYVEHLCKVLREEGIIDYECNKRCLTGFIDIYIPEQGKMRRGKYRMANSPRIIEVKKNNSSFNMKSALGQLLFYSTAIPDACLYIATPSKMPPAYREIFRMYDVEVWG